MYLILPVDLQEAESNPIQASGLFKKRSRLFKKEDVWFSGEHVVIAE